MGIEAALSGALPALFFMWYVDKVDAKRPEPRSVLRKVALFGGLSTLPCIIIELVLDKGFGINPKTVPGAIETSFLSAGLVEESAKAVCLYLAVWRHPAFRGYAAHMRTAAFAAAVDRVLAEAAGRTTAVMCSEAV